MNRVRILLADDNADHRMLLSMALLADRPDALVTTVGSGSEFLEVIGRQQFDCVVLDYHLGDARADQLLVVAAPKLGRCPAIVTSCMDAQRVAVSSFRSGCVDFLPKNEAADEGVLWGRIQQAIGQSRQHLRQRRRLERRERYLARLVDTDHLTHLYNRRYFERCLQQGRWRSDRRQWMSCVMLDVDHFKQVNDSYGHAAGDAVLVAVAQAVRDSTTPDQPAMRWGGEEILILLPSSKLAEAWAWADRLRRHLESTPVHTQAHAIAITASFGVTTGTVTELGPAMVDRADRAMYLAKSRGRNAVCTAPMVDLEQTLDTVGHSGRGLEERQEQLMQRRGASLGPEQWDRLTRHGEQVGDMAVRLGQFMRLKPEVLENIRMAALLHDVGDSVIPEEVLARPRRLTDDERSLVNTHADEGARIVQRLGADAQVAQMIRQHHDAFDQAQGREQSLGARVLAVADAMSDMITGRPYRPAQNAAAVLAELRRHRGRHFDPDVVDAAYFVGCGPESISHAA